jgi:hypothetical protein
MTWPLSSLADILDSGPDVSDPLEAAEDWRLLDDLAQAVAALAERLKHEPGLSRAAAELFCKTSTNASGIHFRSLIWPQARRLAGLPLHAKGGRPQGGQDTQKSGAGSGRTKSRARKPSHSESSYIGLCAAIM